MMFKKKPNPQNEDWAFTEMLLHEDISTICYIILHFGCKVMECFESKKENL
jgi:hypothetical protein